MALALFAGIRVSDLPRAREWYERLLGSEPSFFPNDVEAVWELEESRSVYIELSPERAGGGLVTLFLDDLDAFVDAASARGIEPSSRETYDNGVRKTTYHDPDGNELGCGGAPGRLAGPLGRAVVAAVPRCCDGWVDARVQHVVPILNVRDVPASLTWYVDVLGFGLSWSWGEPATYGGVVSGRAEIQFCQDGQGGPGTWVAVWVDDVDALHDRLRERGVDIRQPPTTFEWGVREMNVADPDGHRIRFSTGSDGPPDGPGLVD
jgi:catechol 2,3-dioxygenase-like lactoylglutathione lyase family enzyme